MSEPRRIPPLEAPGTWLERLWEVEAAARAVATVDFPSRALAARFGLKEALRLLDEALQTPGDASQGRDGGLTTSPDPDFHSTRLPK
jgi:hypothetical protein